MKKWSLVLAMLCIVAMVGCNLKGSAQKVEMPVESESATEAVQEEVASSEVTEEPSSEVAEESSSEEVSEVASEEVGSETVDEEYMQSVVVKTMWIQEMTAEDAALSSIWGKEYSDDTKATVVGLWMEDEAQADSIGLTMDIEFYTMENEEYVLLEEYTYNNSAPICGSNRSLVIVRFPADKVDVNNLYMRVSDGFGAGEKYFKIDAENFMDIYSLEASEELVPEQGEIIYVNDIPFIITGISPNHYANPFDYEFNQYPGYMEKRDNWEKWDMYDVDRTITLMPLTGQIEYGFSFWDTCRLSDDYDSEEYAIGFVAVYDDTGKEGTIERNEANLCIRYNWYYDEAEWEAANEENPYNNDFFDTLRERINENGMEDNSYLETLNENHPNTKIYMFRRGF